MVGFQFAQFRGVLVGIISQCAYSSKVSIKATVKITN